MKFLTLFSFIILCSATVLAAPADKKQHQSSLTGTGVHELTDLQGVVFARGLVDWRSRPIDSLQMDIYYPTGATSDKKYPVIMFCHAGGFSGGNRFNVSAICDRYADEGFIAVGFDYRVGYRKGKGDSVCTTDSTSQNEAIYRAIQDANAATRFIVANATQLNVDTSWIFVAGSSAGGVLSLVDTYVNDSTAQIYYPYIPPLLGGLQNSGNNLTNKYKIKGIVSMWGAMPNADKLIDSNYTSVPTIIFKGTEDGGLPDSVGSYLGCVTLPILYSGVAIYVKLMLEKTATVFHELPLGNHPAYDYEFCVIQSTCFLKSIIQGRAYTGRYEYFDPSCQ